MEALIALRAALRPGDELIVVDSASRSADVSLAADAAGARVIRADRPGASYARNLGWQHARRPLVAFTDDDCRPEPGWLDSVEREFADARVGFVYGAVLGDEHGEALSVTTATDRQPLPAGSVRAVDGFGHGANLAVRRHALADVSGWEVRLGAGVRLAGGEDADLALRLLRAGWGGVFAPDAAVRHVGWRGRRAALRATWGYGLGAGAVAARSRRADGDWWLLRHELGARGVAQVARDARAGYEFGVIAGTVRLAAVVVGAAQALAGAA